MLSIIIPTYNERDNLEALISRLETVVRVEHEIVVVDDDSPDGTSTAVEALSKRFPSLRLIKRKNKRGLTGAILAGVQAAKGGIILVMDADLSHPPEKVPELFSALSDADLIIGSRLMNGGGVKNWPASRRIISKGAETLARVLINTRCSDPLSGFFAVRREILERTDFRTKGYKLLLNILADNPSIRLKEVPYVFMDRNAGASKLDFGEVITYLFDLVQISHRRSM